MKALNKQPSILEVKRWNEKAYNNIKLRALERERKRENNIEKVEDFCELHVIKNSRLHNLF